MIKLPVAHDLITELGMRPGMDVAIGDANFGVISAALAAAFTTVARNHPMVLRMTPRRAQSILRPPDLERNWAEKWKSD